MPDTKYQTHESFGVLNFNKVTYGMGTGNRPLFGSSILHTHVIQLTISSAQIKRETNNDWIMPDKTLIEVDMSLSQFADAITSFSKGEGTPVTIRFIQGRGNIKEGQFTNKRLQFDEEFEETMEKLASTTNDYYTKIEQILAKPNIGKADRDEIKKQLDFLQAKITSTVPFIKQQFTEQMDKTVVEAKGEIEAFVQNRLAALGTPALKKELGQAGLEEK